MFKRATRKQARLRIGLLGPAGSGKTKTALRMAAAMVPEPARDRDKNGGRSGIAFIDTEHNSASLYVGDTNEDGGEHDFDVVDLSDENEWPGRYSVENYVKAIKGAAAAGYPVLIIDSLSHAWAGPGGLLEFKDEVAARQKGGNSWTAWREVTPKHNELVDTILSYPGDVLITMRVKMEHVQEEVNGRKVIRKVGLQPIQRDGLEYEFTVILDIEADTHKAIVTKTRCSRIADQSFTKPGAGLADVLIDWRNQGGRWHDDTWEKEKGKFFAALKEQGFNYDQATEFWQSNFPERAHLKPSQIGRDGRMALFRAIVQHVEKEAKKTPPKDEDPPDPPAEEAADAPEDDSERTPGEEG